MIDNRRRDYLSGRLFQRAEQLALAGKGYQVYIPSRNVDNPIPFIIVAKGSGVFYIDCVDEDGLCISVPIYDTTWKQMKIVMLGRVNAHMSVRSTISATDANIEKVFAMQETDGGRPLLPYINTPIGGRFIFFGGMNTYRQMAEREHPVVHLNEYRRLKGLAVLQNAPKNDSNPLSDAIQNLRDNLPF